MSDEALEPEATQTPAEDATEEEDENEVVPHSEDDEEQLPWCVGCFG